MQKKIKSNAIPVKVKAEVRRIVSDFNAKTFSDPEVDSYIIRFKKHHLYLDRSGSDYKVPCQVCRLSYTGDPTNWDFAIYRYTRKEYDPEEWIFPGAGLVDGTIESALEAGLEAYP